MTPPSEEQNTPEQHAEVEQSLQRFLSCDDLLGKVYSSCTDPATRHALRVSCPACYRSPAINSFIEDLMIGPRNPEDAASALAAFPRFARLKKLTIQKNDVAALFQHLSGSAPEAYAARAKLQSVDSLFFSECRLDTLEAAAMPTLFPAMRSDHFFQLWLGGDCLVSSGALGILAAQAYITELKWCGVPNTLHGLASFGSLRSLELFWTGSLSLEPLCAGTDSAGPQLQLTRLELSYSKNVTGLDVCLACHPLQELELMFVLFPPSLAPSMHLASHTLRAMRVNLNLTFPDISVASFPALHLLEIGGLDLQQVPGMNAEESVQRCTSLASSIAGFSCVRCMETGIDPSFHINGHTWPPAQFIELLQGLTPLIPSFSKVKCLTTEDTNLGCGAMHTIAALFPNLVRLFLFTSEDEPHHMYSDEYGLSEVVLLPGLKELEVLCESPPKDTIRALLARQDLVLRLVATDDGCRQRLGDVYMLWEALRRDNQNGARLEVGSRDEDEDEWHV